MSALRPLLKVVCCLLCVSASVAHADIYSFIDEMGVTHYSNVPDDPRFSLFARTPMDHPVAQNVSLVDWKKRADSLAGLIEATAQRRAVHPALLKAVVAAESAFDAHAVSRAGAQGLMQLLPQTARRYGVADPFDPAANLDGGARYLSDLLKRYHNNLALALAAYNAGEEAVERHGGKIPPYAETQAYVPTVLKLYRRFLGHPG